MSWSEFPFALVLIQTDEQQTMPLAMARLIREFNVFFNEMGAVTMLFTIPIFLVFLFAQKYFIRGIAAGALKG
jgi:multiple sugar transport system permease protein